MSEASLVGTGRHTNASALEISPSWRYYTAMSSLASIRSAAEARHIGGNNVPGAQRREIVNLLCAYVGESLRVTDEWSAAHGINSTDARALALLGAADRVGAPMTAGEMGAALGLSSPATSALIARLESVGHLSRGRDPRDRRRVLLTASPSARRSAVAYFQPMGDAVTTALEGCGSDEMNAIVAFLERLVQEMHIASAE